MKSEFINSKTYDNLSNWLNEYCCEIEVETITDSTMFQPIYKIPNDPFLYLTFKPSIEPIIDLNKYNTLRFIDSKQDIINFEYPTLSKEESIIILPRRAPSR